MSKDHSADLMQSIISKLYKTVTGDSLKFIRSIPLVIIMFTSFSLYSQTREICGELPPAGWITTRVYTCYIVDKYTSFIGRTITKIDELPVNSTLTICGELPPAGWVTTSVNGYCAQFGSTYFISRTIRKIAGLPKCTTLSVCGDLPPSGWSTVSISGTCATLGNLTYLQRTIRCDNGPLQQPIINFDPIGDKTICAGPFKIKATVSSGMSVNFSLSCFPEGIASLSGTTINITGRGKGIVTITASVNTNECYTSGTLSRSFSIVAPPPPGGLAVSGITDNTAQLSWNSVSDATMYNLRYKADADASWTNLSVNNITTLNLTGLKAISPYSFEVAASCSSGGGDYSDPFRFSTICNVPEVSMTDKASGKDECLITTRSFSTDGCANITVHAEATTGSSAQGKLWIKIYDGSQLIDSTLHTGSNIITGNRKIGIKIPKHTEKTLRFSAPNLNASSKVLNATIYYGETIPDCPIPSNGLTDRASGKDNCQLTTRSFTTDVCAKIAVDAVAMTLGSGRGQLWIEVYDGDTKIQNAFFEDNTDIIGHSEFVMKMPKGIAKNLRFVALNQLADAKAINATVTYSEPVPDCVIPLNGLTDRISGKDNCQLTTRIFTTDICARIAVDAIAMTLGSGRGQLWIEVYDGDTKIQNAFFEDNTDIIGHTELMLRIPKGVVKNLRFVAPNLMADAKVINAVITYSEPVPVCTFPSNGLTDKVSGKDNCQLTTKSFATDVCAKIVVDAIAMTLGSGRGQLWIEVYDGDTKIQNAFFEDNTDIIGHTELILRIPKGVIKNLRFSAPNLTASAQTINVTVTYSGSINTAQSSTTIFKGSKGADLGEKVTINGVSLTVAPNPVTGMNAYIIYKLTDEGRVSIKVVDMYGRLIQNAELGSQKTGDHTYQLNNLNRLAKGNYIIVLEQNGKIIERKVFLLNR